MLFKMKHKYQEGEPGAGGGGETPTVAELQAQLATANASVQKLEAKQVEILGEAKTAKEARRIARWFRRGFLPQSGLEDAGQRVPCGRRPRGSANAARSLAANRSRKPRA